MKRLFTAALIVLLAAVALVAAIENDPGYLLISYDNYTLETSVWIGLAAFLVLCLLVFGSGYLIRKIVRRGDQLGSWWSSRGSKRLQRRATQGLIAYIEGNWEKARRMLAYSAENSDTPLANYLLAARSSHALGDEAKTRIYLSKAENSTSGAGIAVELTQAELQLQSGQLEECLATLQRARRNASKHPSVLKLLQQVYVGLGEWSALIEILPELRKHKLRSPEQLLKLERGAYHGLIEQAAESAQSSEAALKQVWAKMPKEMVRDGETVQFYVEKLIAAGNQSEAERVIVTHLKRDWCQPLVALYGTLEGDDVSKQLLRAEGWLRERNSDATLFLALGRVALRNQLWGKARGYFESCLKLEQNPQACAELGRLLSHLGEHELSNDYFQQGLLASTATLPQLPMPHKPHLAG